jgi:hypothetical protein
MEAQKVKVETLYTFEQKFRTWYIDFNDDQEIQKPYSVFRDEHFRGCYRTLGEALERVFAAIGKSDWVKK